MAGFFRRLKWMEIKKQLVFQVILEKQEKENFPIEHVEQSISYWFAEHFPPKKKTPFVPGFSVDIFRP